jgi:hypothetical protein
MASETINVRTTTAAKVVMDPKAKAELRANMVRVLERGHLSGRLDIEKGDRYYEWVSKDPSDIARLKSMGFKMCDDPELAKNSLHNDGTANITIGDVVLMEAPLELKEMLNEVNKEIYQRRHGKSSKQEETDFAGRLKQTGLPSFNESTSDAVDGASLKTIVSG